jgi:hypothetical protein
MRIAQQRVVVAAVGIIARLGWLVGWRAAGDMQEYDMQLYLLLNAVQWLQQQQQQRDRSIWSGTLYT